MSSSRRTCLVALAILVTTFVALYPYLGAMEFCEKGECPYAMSQSSHGSSVGLASACVVTVLAALSAGMLAPALLFGRRVFASHGWATQLHLSPESPPPRSSF